MLHQIFILIVHAPVIAILVCELLMGVARPKSPPSSEHPPRNTQTAAQTEAVNVGDECGAAPVSCPNYVQRSIISAAP